MRSRLASVLALALAAPPLVHAQAPAVRLAANTCAWSVVPGVVWANSVRGFSSQYSTSSFAATQALGAPNVFPRYGDLGGTWAPRSGSSPLDWIEVLFPVPTWASELWVFETYGAGGTYGIGVINPDGSVTPVSVGTPGRLAQAAGHIVVPLEPARMVGGVRLETSSQAAGTYVEIDAVGAVPSPACRPGAAPVAAGLGSAVRLAPTQLGMQTTPPNAVWGASVVSFTSQYNAGNWAATSILGPPNVFPRHGDLAGAWAPSSSSSEEDAIVVQFPVTEAQEIWVYETYNPGGLHRIEDVSAGSPVLLWSGTAAEASDDEARVLRVTLASPRPISVLRLVTSSAAAGGYAELDAVALVPAAGGVAK